MPTYTYHCEQCDHEFDQHQSFSESALSTCPVCKKEALYKVYKPAQVVFKGSGYYVTDSRAKSSTLTSKNGSDSDSTETKAEKAEKSESPKKKAESKKKSETSSKSKSTPATAD